MCASYFRTLWGLSCAAWRRWPMFTYTEEQLLDPGRTIVRDASDTVVATFTVGARTAVVRATERTITEAGFSRTVTSHDRASLLPAPLMPPVDYTWLVAAWTS